MNKRKLQNRKCKKIKETKCLLKNQKAITLIALVISIIVMLILAGVSLNATIGENGIMTQAKNATYMQSIAVLEEYLQDKYIQNYERIDESESKVVNLENIYPEYFYIPANNGYGRLRYIINDEGKALYLIQKNGLPDEIKNQLRDGEAGQGKYEDYVKMNDVYGVTSDLKVYYVKNNGETILGISKEQLDEDDPVREVVSKEKDNNLYSILEIYDSNKDGTINAQEVKGIKELEISPELMISFTDLYKFYGLEKLTLKNLTLNNLDGIQNVSKLNYIFFKNCKIGNYSKLRNLKDVLKYLYFFNTTDEEIEKLCSNENGIGNCDFGKLQYFAISGEEELISSEYIEARLNKSENKISTLEPLNNLSSITKNAIENLSLENNEISDLSVLKEFTNVRLLRVECNNLTTLDGLENMKQLSKISASNNQLGINDSLEESETDALYSLKDITTLERVNLANNNIKRIDYISSNPVGQITYLKLQGNSEMISSSVSKIAEIYNAIDNGNAKNIDNKYLKYLSTSNTLSYPGITLADIEDIDYLKNMSADDKLKVTSLDLSTKTTVLNNNTKMQDNTLLSDSELNEIVSSFLNLTFLNLSGQRNLETVDFLNSLKYLKELRIEDTNIISDDEVRKINVYGSGKEKGITLYINNKYMNLKELQDLISVSQTVFRDSDLVKQLENCTEITYLHLNNSTPCKNLDLSKCTKLKRIFWGYFICENIILPASIEELEGWSNSKFTFSNGTKLKKIGIYELSNQQQRVTDTLNSIIDTGTTIEKVYFTDFRSQNPLLEVNLLEYLSKIDIKELYFRYVEYNGIIQNPYNLGKYIEQGYWKGKLLNLKTIKFEGCVSADFGITSLDFLKDNKELVNLTITNNKITELSALKNLENLESVNLKGNSITSLKGIENLINLKSLDISNNSLYDTFSYQDGSKVNNIDIIKQLNKNGSLNELHIGGNEFQNLQEIQNLKWTVYKE